MEYGEIIKEIGNINGEEFTMDSFQKIGNICKEINRVYRDSMVNSRLDAEDHYIQVKEYLNDIVFDKLKEKLGFENEIIRKIVEILNFADRIKDIYVLDGNVIVELMTNESSVTFLLHGNGLMDINSYQFSSQNDEYEYKKSLVSLLNDAIPKLLKNDSLNESLKLEDNLISYNISDLNVYANHSLSDMFMDNSGNTKTLVRYGNELGYFDIRRHNGYLVLANNDYRVNKLSTMLKNETKVKRI